MQVFELQGELRTDLGKKATNLLRAEGKVPCVLYGGKENVHFSVVEKDLQKLLYTPGCIHRKSKCSRTELRSCYA